MQFWRQHRYLLLAAVLLLAGIAVTTAVRATAVYAEETSVDQLRKENEQLRIERDALRGETVLLKKKLARMEKQTSEELEEAKIEIDVLKAKMDRLNDQLQLSLQAQKAGPARATPDACGLLAGTAVMIYPGPKPGEPLKGKITEVSGSSSLVAVSLGSEDGIQAGQELECYRLGSVDSHGKNPPVYFGKVRIMRIAPRESVGQYIPLRGMDRRPTVGDEVASELLPR